MKLPSSGVFTFICKESGSEWSAKQHKGELEAAAVSAYDLQRKLVQAALAEAGSGGVQSSFSFVTPCSAVFQVIVGGAVGGAFIGGGGAAAGGAPAGGAAAAAEAPPAEEKKVEEESEEEMGFSLFDD